MRVTLTAAPSEARRTMEIMSDDTAPGCLSDSMQSLIAENLLAEDVPDGLEVGRRHDGRHDLLRGSR